MLTAVTRLILENFALEVIEGIKTNIREKAVTQYGAMNTTGKMADSLGYRIDDEGLTIYSSERFFTVLETGRKPTSPGAAKGSPTLREQIEAWIQNKGIQPEGISQKSLAFLITRKIHEQGSLLYRQGGKSGVISDYINEQYIKENLVAVMGERFKNYLIQEFLIKSARQ